MDKFLTRIETTVGYETYRILMESEDTISSIKGFYYILNAKIVSVQITKSNASIRQGPFNIGVYDILRFPINKTLMSQQTK
jgi:hypothetical protein